MYKLLVGLAGDDWGDRIEELVALFGDVEDEINGILPDGREKALVKTKLEEALYFAVSAAFAGGSDDV
jgi:hypothetical protein